jgi:hypothetical protein
MTSSPSTPVMTSLGQQQLATPPSGKLQPATVPSGQQQPVGEFAEAQLASAELPPRAGPWRSEERREAQLASPEQPPRAGPWHNEDRREAQPAPVHQPPQAEEQAGLGGAPAGHLPRPLRLGGSIVTVGNGAGGYTAIYPCIDTVFTSLGATIFTSLGAGLGTVFTTLEPSSAGLHRATASSH